MVRDYVVTLNNEIDGEVVADVFGAYTLDEAKDKIRELYGVMYSAKGVHTTSKCTATEFQLNYVNGKAVASVRKVVAA